MLFDPGMPIAAQHPLRERLGFGAAFGLLGAAAAFFATLVGPIVYWPLGWTALAFVGVAGAYVAGWPGVFGKRPDGSLSPGHFVAWWPYLLMIRGAYELQRVLLREAPCHEVVPGLWVGRRPRRSELPPGVRLIVDLCAELPAAPGVVASATYLSSPTLDATMPTSEELERIVDAILDAPGPVLLHCAAGHGRSAAVAAAVAIARGACPDLAAAILTLRDRRRWIRLNREQRDAVERFAASRKART